MAEPIVSHVWRPSTAGGHESRPYAQRPCVYMACDRPLSEHVRPAPGGSRCPCPVFDLEPHDDVCLCGHYAERHEGGAGACMAELP